MFQRSLLPPSSETSSSETSVGIYQITGCSILEERHLHAKKKCAYRFKICLAVIKEFFVELALLFANKKWTIFVAIMQIIVHCTRESAV
jgi:hypothetical protein